MTARFYTRGRDPLMTPPRTQWQRDKRDGPVVPMDAEQPHWITKAIIIAGGIYAVATWF